MAHRNDLTSAEGSTCVAARGRVSFALHPELYGVELMQGRGVTDTFDAHMHECFTVGVTLAGSEHFVCRGNSHVARAGDIALLNPGEVHEGGPGPEGFWSYQMIYAPRELLDGLAAELGDGAGAAVRFDRVVVADARLAAAIGRVQAAMAQAPCALERQSVLLELLAALIARYSSRQAVPPHVGTAPVAVRRVKQYLEAHYAGNVRLESLSELSGLSPYHLVRTFRRAIGMPPHTYLRQVRVEQAKRMLRADVPMAEVALSAGFTDQSHMSRLFKRILGITPGAYRTAVRLPAAHA